MIRNTSVALAAALLAGLGMAAGAMAQGAQPVGVTLFGQTVSWKTSPSTFLTAELRDAGGTKAIGAALSEETGAVVVDLIAVDAGRPGDAFVRPSDRLSLDPIGATPVTVTVPALTVDADAPSDRVAGTAPAGAQLEVGINTGPRPTDVISRPVTATAGGTFSLSLAGQQDITDETTGQVRYTAPGAHRYTARFKSFEADFTLGLDRAQGRASPGLEILLVLSAADNAPKGSARTEVLGGYDWTLPGDALSDLEPLSPGDHVRLTVLRSPVNPAQTLNVTVPALGIVLDPGNNSVAGSGPANTDLVVELMSPDDTSQALPVTTGPSGTFSLDLGGIVTLGPGWRGALVHTAAPGVRVRAQAAVPRVVVGVDSPIVSGITSPFSPVTVTLTTAAGAVKATASAVAAGNGAFSARTAAVGQTVNILPGDRVAVQFVAGQPLTIPVPVISAHTDPTTDTISGQAPAGATLRVARLGHPDAAGRSATADGAGHYVVDYRGRLEIEPPMYGEVEVTDPTGRIFLIGWSAPQLSVNMKRGAVSGTGPPLRGVGVSLTDSGGALVAARALAVGEPAAGGAPGWVTSLADEAGVALPPRPGDRLQATVGDDDLSLIVPELTGRAQPASDLVSGQTTPRAGLTIQVVRSLGVRSDPVYVTADADGHFSHGFGGTFDIRANDTVVLATTAAGHTVTNEVSVPGLRLQLDQARLTGVFTPGSDAVAELRSAGGVRSSVAVRTAGDGRFELTFTAADGRMVLPAAGDQIEVRAAQGAPADNLAMTVPELTLDVNTGTDTARGRATPGGLLTLSALDTFRPSGALGVSQLQPTLRADGTYTAALGPDYDVRPGSEVAVLYAATTGHSTSRSTIVPIVNAQHSGPHVCGFGPPAVDVAATLLQAGVPKASASGRTSAAGAFDLQLQDSGGLVATASGQTVRTQLPGGGGDVVLPTLRLEVDWEAGVLSGTGPANTAFTVVAPARACLGSADWLATDVIADDRTGGQGELYASVGLAAPGEGFELAFLNATGNRTYRQAIRLLGQAYVGQDRVAGRGSPMTAVSVTLHSASGTERARAAGRTDGDGAYEVVLRDAGGRSAVIGPGDRVALQAPGDAAELQVEPLAVQFQPGSDLVGSAPAGRLVQVVLTLADGRVVSVGRRADAGGQVRYGAADVSPRASWSWSDVIGAQLVLRTPDGHQLIAEPGVPAVPTPTPTPSPTAAGTPSSTPPGPTPSPTTGATAQPTEPTPVTEPGEIFLPRVVKRR
jgi:hypothetical protein